jgi:(1->4)-alpha-D-glucan 1-alpha-D-glucosylmutase
MQIPNSTYRLQFSPAFGFREARVIVDYLADLGMTGLYASPIFASSAGSEHGYDLVDPNRLNPELGTIDDFKALTQEVWKYGMGWIQDIVPNHMAYDGNNRMLMDVFENGRASRYYDFFDIDWHHPDEALRGRILAPILGRLYRESLEDGEIRLRYDEAGLSIQYHNLRFPLKIESYINVLSHQIDRLEQQLGKDNPMIGKLHGVSEQLKNLVSRYGQDERAEQIQWVKRQLWELYTTHPEIKQFLDDLLQTFNGIKEVPESFSLLDRLLSEQIFRLSFWKVATEEINYRRFFNINGLICVRVENEAVFNHTHSMIIRLCKEEKMTGLRIDHIDGLYDPAGYLNRLRDRIGPVYTVVEKIMKQDEPLPTAWPVQGTTGYDFLNYANGLFCDQHRERFLYRLYLRFTGFKIPYDELVYEKKRLMIERYMTGDVDNLARLLKRISSADRYGSDLTLYGMKRAIIEVMSCFPVYRTYISHGKLTETDRFYVTISIKKAHERNPDLVEELLFLERVLLLQHREDLPDEEKQQWLHFVMRFQQFTGPLMAKGVEDTALYVFNPLVSLNEVGGDPSTFGTTLEEWHTFNVQRADRWPNSMNATSTHDIKRGEDVRSRIHVLSEIPDDWNRQFRRWATLNRRKKRIVRRKTVPDKNDEYFLYQTLVGVFPFSCEYDAEFVERIKRYMIKAIREAKVHTAWIEPDTKYEEALLEFIEELLTLSRKNQFLKEFLPFQKKVAHYGILNSLSQAILKITAPGIPDFYQGTELWDLSLVDPDNRSLVDFEIRRRFLNEIQDATKENVLKLITDLWSAKEDGRLKLFLIHRALHARTRYMELFQQGRYSPIAIGGRRKDHTIAFCRHHRDAWAMIIAPRFLTQLVREGELPLGRQVWEDTYLMLPSGAPGIWRNAITAEIIRGEQTLPIGDILRHFPAALLTSEEGR